MGGRGRMRMAGDLYSLFRLRLRLPCIPPIIRDQVQGVGPASGAPPTMSP